MRARVFVPACLCKHFEHASHSMCVDKNSYIMFNSRTEPLTISPILDSGLSLPDLIDKDVEQRRTVVMYQYDQQTLSSDLLVAAIRLITFLYFECLSSRLEGT